MGRDKIPKTIAGFLIQVEHFLYMEDFFGYPIKKYTSRMTTGIVINSRGALFFIFIAPILFPVKRGSLQGTMIVAGELVVDSKDIRVIHFFALYDPRDFFGFRKLGITNFEGQLVGHDLPALATIVGHIVWIKVGDPLLIFPHRF